MGPKISKCQSAHRNLCLVIQTPNQTRRGSNVGSCSQDSSPDMPDVAGKREGTR